MGACVAEREKKTTHLDELLHLLQTRRLLSDEPHPREGPLPSNEEEQMSRAGYRFSEGGVEEVG